MRALMVIDERGFPDVEAIEGDYIGEHCPNAIYRHSGPVGPTVMALHQANADGWVLTTVRHREEWSWLPPRMKLLVHNGRSPAEMDLLRWALTLEGVPKTTAKSIVDKENFHPGSRSKYEPAIVRAIEAIEAAAWAADDIWFDRPDDRKKYELVDDLPFFIADTPYAADIETTGLDPRNDRLVGVSVTHTPHTGYYIPCPDGKLPPMLEHTLARSPAIWHNGKFDIGFLVQKGYQVATPAGDTQILAWLAGIDGSLKLKRLGSRILHEPVINFAEVVGEEGNFADVPLELATRYACQDTDLTFRLHPVLLARIADTPQEKVYRELELPMVPVLAAMELAGAPVYLPTVKEIAVDAHDVQRQVWDTIVGEAGYEFNLNSAAHLNKLLYDERKLKPLRETKTGYSTDKYTLEMLAIKDWLVELILDYRGLTKLLGTYTEPLLDQYGDDGWVTIYGSFNQTIARTGRLTASRPNLQNQPSEVRRAYRARPGRVLIAADYSQQELRIMAWRAQDPAMLEAFENGVNIHQQTAEKFNCAKRKAKAVNFGIPYGAGKKALSRTAQCEEWEAGMLLRQHRKHYPAIWEQVEEDRAFARATGYSETEYGRRRYLPTMHSAIPELVADAERQASNHTIQGAAADVVKRALIDVANDVQLQAMSCRPILQIHDEIVFEMPLGEEEAAKARIVEIMEAAPAQVGIGIPLPVEIHHGETWYELK